MTVKLALSFFERLAMIFKIEKRKYERKGLISTIVGFSLLFSIIYIAREIGVRVWPEHVEDKAFFFFVGAVALHYIA